MYSLLGQVGHFLIVLSFVASVVSALAFFKASNAEHEDLGNSNIWKRLASTSFFIHGLGILGVVGTLFYIIYTHQFQYHYAWAHSSMELPVYYMISCFWEGQEGSFLLWIFWHVLLGVVLIATNKTWLNSMMAVFMAVQAFLISMILGVVIGELKIGSSPFLLLREAMPELPVFQLNPDYIPADGKGLNPLLQNYWMVIHPPTLFLGFATTLIPFAYAIAGLWKKNYTQWIRPGLPWALFSACVLGVGILMGGYWAYETLNFGGYWNWDPVENAVYIPWLILVAAIHTMIAHKKSGRAVKSSIWLVVVSFLLILYATFLTRSGILGNASVHSFTDLGLSGQLLLYLLTFTILSVWLIFYRWKQIPESSETLTIWHREFWIYIGVTLLSLASFQVLVTTSIPVYSAVANLFGGELNIAPPSDPIKHYTYWQLAFMLGIVLASGIGQYFWWKKPNAKTWLEMFKWPVAGGLLVATVFIYFGKVGEPLYILLVTFASFSLIANASIIVGVFKNSPRLGGGAITHIGVALMLIGVLFSSGYSEVVSKNTSGLVYRKEFSEEMNRDNILLWRGTATDMGKYKLTYKGTAMEVEGFPTYVKTEFLKDTRNQFRMIAKGNLDYDGKTYFKLGDTVKVRPENTYYAIEYRNTEKDEKFILFPRAQVNPNMGLLASPDIKRFWNKDLYTHVSSVPDPEEDRKWGEQEVVKLKIGEQSFFNDYVTKLIAVNKLEEENSKLYGSFDAGVKATFQIFANDQTFLSEPIFLIKGNEVARVPSEVGELGIRVDIQDINPETGTFTFGVSTAQKEWVIFKAIEKPGINILWAGTLVLVIGFVFAIRRRYLEFISMRDKGVELA